jgi:hypothetical protein
LYRRTFTLNRGLAGCTTSLVSLDNVVSTGSGRCTALSSRPREPLMLILRLVPVPAAADTLLLTGDGDE